MKLFYTYKDIMKLLDYSKSKAYGIIREINVNLSNKGIRTEKGRVLISAFNEAYGIKKEPQSEAQG